MSPAYYIDLENARSALLNDSNFERYSERHHIGKIDSRLSWDARKPAEILAGIDGDVMFVLYGGLPSREELDAACAVLSVGHRVYFYWIREEVLEVVTEERANSFRNHRRVVNLYWRWRAMQKGRRKRRAEKKVLRDARRSGGSPWHMPSQEASAPVWSGSKRFNFLSKEGDTVLAEGRGLYFRLDYWAKLQGGGSYGHTCYQAKALNKTTREGLIAVTPNEYRLLNDLGISQISVPGRNIYADEYTLVENGAAYQGVVDGLLALYRPSYVFERLVLGNACVARACRREGIPYIAEFNGSELTMSKVFGGREMENAETLQALEKENFELADIISVVSDPVKDEVVALGIPEEKIIINPNGVDLDAYGPLPEEERTALRTELGFTSNDAVLGFCGTFGGWHGIEVLAEALPRICEARPNAKILLIGGGHNKPQVLEQIEKHGLQERVADAGMVAQREAARLLAACDIFLSPHSRNMGDRPFFGSPTKLFEYMAYGGGIVCSDLVQLGEVMRPALTLADKDGTRRENARSVLVRPGSVDDLVDASVWLIDEPDLRRKLGQNAMTAARKYYSWDVHVQSLFAFARGETPGGYNEDRRNL